MHRLKTMTSFRAIARNAGTSALVLTLSISLGLNVYFAWKIRKTSIRTFPEIKVNDKLPSPLLLLDADGKSVRLGFDDPRPTVLYVLSPLCSWCKRNEANIKKISELAGSRFRFVGLSLVSTNLKEYVAEGRAPFPVYRVQSQDQAVRMGLGSTPTTIVITPGARVEKVWTGAYMSENVKQIEEFFGVKLPGLEELDGSPN